MMAPNFSSPLNPEQSNRRLAKETLNQDPPVSIRPIRLNGHLLGSMVELNATMYNVS
jgi:hypothetical protein